MEVDPVELADPHFRDYLQDVDLFEGGRVMRGGELEASESRRLDQHLAFFTQVGGPVNVKNFALVPIWRLAETNRHADELNLHISQFGTHYVTFNGKDAHGTWLYNQLATPACFLDVKFNARYGEPDASGDDLDPDN